ncbi:hypothetical protein DWF04_022405 [Cereibacter sphaeroides f. sp. denitrificans]
MAPLDKAILKERAAQIVQQHRGIYPVYETFYIQSIIYAAERSDTAFQRFDKAVAESRSAALIYAAVQEALTHAGALSRFFWPAKKDSQLAAARGERLREAFALEETSALKCRHLRNALEHFDEDLDLFLLEDRCGFFFPGPLVDDHTLADEDIGNIFKLVDPNGGVCVLLGKKFEFVPIWREVQRVLSRAREMDEQGSRL